MWLFYAQFSLESGHSEGCRFFSIDNTVSDDIFDIILNIAPDRSGSKLGIVGFFEYMCNSLCIILECASELQKAFFEHF